MRRWGLVFLVVLFSGVLNVYAENISYDDKGRRDPMWPLVGASGAIISYSNDVSYDDILLEGIVSDHNGFIAIINGNIVKKGDILFDNFLIQDVKENAVVIKKDAETFTLILNKEE